MNKRVALPTARPAELTEEQIAHALQRQCGNVSATAKALGVSRSTINRRIAGSSVLETIRDDARETLIDVAENALLKAIKGGNIAAIIFALKTQGRSRGYVERVEMTGAESGPIQTEIILRQVPERQDD